MQLAIVDFSKPGHFNIAEILLKHGIDVNAKDIDDKTALMLACLVNHIAVVQFLIDHQADVNIKDDLGETALDLTDTDSTLVVDMLKKAGAVSGKKDAPNT